MGKIYADYSLLFVTCSFLRPFFVILVWNPLSLRTFHTIGRYFPDARNGPALATVGTVREKFPKLSSLSLEAEKMISVRDQDIDNLLQIAIHFS